MAQLRDFPRSQASSSPPRKVVCNVLNPSGHRLPGAGVEGEVKQREHRGHACELKEGFQTLAGDTPYNLLARTRFVATAAGRTAKRLLWWPQAQLKLRGSNAVEEGEEKYRGTTRGLCHLRRGWSQRGRGTRVRKDRGVDPRPVVRGWSHVSARA